MEKPALFRRKAKGLSIIYNLCGLPHLVHLSSMPQARYSLLIIHYSLHSLPSGNKFIYHLFSVGYSLVIR